jgi:hypothetical protein
MEKIMLNTSELKNNNSVFQYAYMMKTIIKSLENFNFEDNYEYFALKNAVDRVVIRSLPQNLTENLIAIRSLNMAIRTIAYGLIENRKISNKIYELLYLSMNIESTLINMDI